MCFDAVLDCLEGEPRGILSRVLPTARGGSDQRERRGEAPLLMGSYPARLG